MVMADNLQLGNGVPSLNVDGTAVGHPWLATCARQRSRNNFPLPITTLTLLSVQ